MRNNLCALGWRKCVQQSAPPKKRRGFDEPRDEHKNEENRAQGAGLAQPITHRDTPDRRGGNVGYILLVAPKLVASKAHCNGMSYPLAADGRLCLRFEMLLGVKIFDSLAALSKFPMRKSETRINEILR